jgi:hypothetical protein
MKKIKEPRLATPRKQELVAWILRDMMAREPRLTLGQARRVFSYGYMMLRKKATAAKVFSIACGIINDKYSMKGRP